jgi:fucose permease
LHAFFGVGALVGPALAAWVLESMRWTAVWLILGFASIILIGLFLLANKGAGSARDSQLPELAPRSPSGHGLFGAAIRCRGVQYGSLFLAVYVGLEIGVGTWAFTYLVGHLHQTAMLAGYTVSGYWLGLTAGRFLISPASIRLGITPAATSFGCLAGVAASSLLVWASPAAALAAVGFVLLGFFLAPLFPTAMAMAPRLASPRLAATAIGVMNGASVLGGSFFSWLSGAVAQGAGVWTLMPIALGLALLLLLLWSRVIAHATAPTSTEADAGAVMPARG